MRPASNVVVEIGPELALPLARDYCRRWRLAHDPEAGEEMFWTGAFVGSTLRAVLGLASIPGGMLVSGIFTDDSDASKFAARMFVERLIEMPCDLWGTLHLPSERMRKMFRTSGWSLMQGVV